MTLLNIRSGSGCFKTTETRGGGGLLKLHHHHLVVVVDVVVVAVCGVNIVGVHIYKIIKVAVFVFVHYQNVRGEHKGLVQKSIYLAHHDEAIGRADRSPQEWVMVHEDCHRMACVYFF